MARTIPVGLTHTLTLTVDDGLTVPRVSPAFDFADMPPVFATAYMVGFLEAVCLEAVKPFLAPGERTVGTRVDVSHVAATPVGMRVTAECELVGIDGRRLSFKVRCRDAAGLIGEGTHERAIIDLARFMERLTAKAAD